MWDVLNVLKIIEMISVSDMLSQNFLYREIVFLMKMIAFNLL